MCMCVPTCFNFIKMKPIHVLLFSEEFFPPRHRMVDYLNDFQTKFNINVRHSVNVHGIQPANEWNVPDGDVHRDKRKHVRFVMRDQDDLIYTCQ